MFLKVSSLEDLPCYNGQFHTQELDSGLSKKGIKMGGDHVEGKTGVEEENKEWVL